ncbi:MAG TPA: ribosome small subunit-dependent GTPase A [Edaphocola sp.]|nr:ribosome small subunit-dependent GTPase A [Edaphocola sp.]
MKALIYKSTGNFYQAKDENGRWCQCRIRGKLKLDKSISTTNPVAVGDWVTLADTVDPEGLSTILTILPRQNYIIRSAINLTFQRHIIAANMDLAVLVASLKNPFTSQGFMDRFLVTAEAYHIPALVVFNKADMHTGNTLLAWKNKKRILEQAGYPTLTVSGQAGEGIDEIKGVLKNKTTLFCGHSGVGKSTLINKIMPGLDLKTGQVSESNEKGRHTTTFAQMFDLDFGGRLIDTPGIKELGLVDIKKEELSHYFPEMAERLNDCRFNNCLHANEPGCAVKAAVSEGDISTERYESYLNLLDSLT